MPPTIMSRAFIARWTRMPRSIGRLSASALSHHDLSLAAFITNIAESDLRHTQVTGSIPVAPTTHSRFLPTCGDAAKMLPGGRHRRFLFSIEHGPCNHFGRAMSATRQLPPFGTGDRLRHTSRVWRTLRDPSAGCPLYAGYASPAGPLPSAAWAAARRAMGTRNAEHET